MNSSLLIVGGISSVMLAAIIWLVAGPLAAQTSVSRAANSELESLFVLHCRYFAQMRHVLGAADRRFLRGRLSAAELQKWGTERRQVLNRFLAALGEDYARLDYLSRRIAVLAPHISRTNELQRIWLGLRFRIFLPGGGGAAGSRRPGSGRIYCQSDRGAGGVVVAARRQHVRPGNRPPSWLEVP